MATNDANQPKLGRQYALQVVHYLRKTITFEDTTAATVGVIPAGSLILKPASGVHVVTAFNDSTTDVVDVGTTDDGDLFATDLDVSAVGFKVLDEDIAGLRVSSEVTVTATYAGGTGDATAGEAEVVIAYIPDNDR